MPQRFANPTPVEHVFNSSGEAYDASQTLHHIHDGDVLCVPSECAVAVLVEAWPVAVGENSGEFHAVDPGQDFDWSKVPCYGTGEDLIEVNYQNSFEMAVRCLERLRMQEAEAASKREAEEISAVYRKLLDEKGL